MLRIETAELSMVTIVGHALMFKSFFCDLRLPTALERFKQEVVKENKDKAEMIEVYLRAIAGILSDNPKQWGDHEEEVNYLNATSDEDWHLRALVALNGKYPEKTSKDAVVAVRICTIQALLNNITRGIENSDTGWLDDLVNDSQWSVRELVALYGKKEHLDTLINDEKACVRMVVATHGIKEHLDILASDDNANVRQIVRQNGNESHQKLVAIKELEQMEITTLKS